MADRKYQDDKGGSLEYPVCYPRAGGVFLSGLESILFFLSFCNDYRSAMPWMWTIESGIFSFAGRIFGSLAFSSIYLWNCSAGGDLFHTQISPSQGSPVSSEMADSSDGWNACLLYLQNDKILSGSSADELLFGESSESDRTGFEKSLRKVRNMQIL